MATIEFEDREPASPLSWWARVLLGALCLLGAYGLWSTIWTLVRPLFT